MGIIIREDRRYHNVYRRVIDGLIQVGYGFPTKRGARKWRRGAYLPTGWEYIGVVWEK